MPSDYTKMIIALESALAGGRLEVTIGTQTVKYGSASDMIARINYLRSQLAMQSDGLCGGESGYRAQAVSGNGIMGVGR